MSTPQPSTCQKHANLQNLEIGDHIDEFVEAAECGDCLAVVARLCGRDPSAGGKAPLPPEAGENALQGGVSDYARRRSFLTSVLWAANLVLAQILFWPALFSGIGIRKLVRWNCPDVYWPEVHVWKHAFYSRVKVAVNMRAFFSQYDRAIANGHIDFVLKPETKRLVLVLDGLLRKTTVFYPEMKRQLYAKHGYDDSDTAFVVTRLPMLEDYVRQAEVLTFIIRQFQLCNAERFARNDVQVVLASHSAGVFTAMEWFRAAPADQKPLISELVAFGPPLAGNPIAAILFGIAPARRMICAPGIWRNRYLTETLNVERLIDAGVIPATVKVTLRFAVGDLALDLGGPAVVLDGDRKLGLVGVRNHPRIVCSEDKIGGHFFKLQPGLIRNSDWRAASEGRALNRVLPRLMAASRLTDAPQRPSAAG